MPNWCTNTLTFPTREEFDSFIRNYGKGSRRFSYQWLIPEPKTQEECEEKYVLHNDEEREAAHLGKDAGWFNWYEWRWDHWGCKWDAICDREDDFIDEGTLSIFFSSPWCEPFRVYKKMAELGIEFSYTWEIEGGSQGSGGGKSDDGTLLCYENALPEDEVIPEEISPANDGNSTNKNVDFPGGIPF